MQTVRIVVIMAMDKSSLFPDESDWTTMSPFTAVQMGKQFALLLLITKISVFAVKQAVPLLPSPLALACLLLRFSIEAVWVFARGGSCRPVSCSVPSASTVSSLFTAGCLPVPWASVVEVPLQSLWSVRFLVECGWYLSEISCSLRVILSEVAASVNSMKLVIAGPVSEICPSGSSGS